MDPNLLKSDDLFFREPRDIEPPPFKNPGHAPDYRPSFIVLKVKATAYLAFHLSVNGQKSVRARVTLFHQLQAKHQIPIKKSVKNKLMTT